MGVAVPLSFMLPRRASTGRGDGTGVSAVREPAGAAMWFWTWGAEPGWSGSARSSGSAPAGG